jgi:hypothetical protein
MAAPRYPNEEQRRALVETYGRHVETQRRQPIAAVRKSAGSWRTRTTPTSTSAGDGQLGNRRKRRLYSHCCRSGHPEF